jgi:transposase
LRRKSKGLQPGADGLWRTTPLVPEQTIPHYPENCASCNSPLNVDPDAKPHMGYYVLELEKKDSGVEVICTLHHYYSVTCDCGHHTKAKPLTGYISVVEGRSRDLRIQEYGLVGPMLATFIASLGVRYRISRPKIRELLNDCLGVELSVGTALPMYSRGRYCLLSSR